MRDAKTPVLKPKPPFEAQVLSSLATAARGRVFNIFLIIRVFEGRAMTRLCQEIVASRTGLIVVSCWNLAATTAR